MCFREQLDIIFPGWQLHTSRDKTLRGEVRVTENRVLRDKILSQLDKNTFFVDTI